MKKSILFFIFSAILFADDITLDEVLKIGIERTYKKDIHNLQKNTLEEKKKKYLLGNYNGVKTDVTYTRDERNHKTNGKVSFGDFYIQGTKEEKEDNFIYGVEKNLKDLFYSENKSQLNKIEIEKEILELEYQKKIEDKEIEILNIYRDIKNYEYEIENKKNQLKTLLEEEKKLIKSYELGGSSKIEVDSVTISIKNSKLEIENSLKKIEVLKRKLATNYNIELGNKNLFKVEAPNIDILKLIANYGESDIILLLKQKMLLEEELKYMKYDTNIPDISLGIEHNKKLDENIITGRFSKKLFDSNYEIKNQKNKISENSLELEQKRKELTITKEEINIKYEEYLSNYQISQNNLGIAKNKFEIKKLEYDLGKINYIDLLEAFEKYTDSKIILEKSKNNLNCYIYELLIKGE